MSAEDNATAEQADIGDALVAALGFEPADGRQQGRKAGSSTVDARRQSDGVVGTPSGNGNPGNGGAQAANRRSKKLRKNRGRIPGTESNGSGGSAAGNDIKSAAKPAVSSDGEGSVKPSAPDTVVVGKPLGPAEPTPLAGAGDAATEGSDPPPARSNGDAEAITDDRSDPATDSLSSPSSSTMSNDPAPEDPPIVSMAAVTGEIGSMDPLDQPPPPNAGDAVAPVEVDADVTTKLEPGVAVPSAPPTISLPAPEVAVAKVDALPGIDDVPGLAPLETRDDEIQNARLEAEARARSEMAEAMRSQPPSFSNFFRRTRRLQSRKVRRVVRHIDPWSVLTFSVLFHLCVFAALLLASVLVWNAAEAAGTIENLETFILELGDYETFEIKGDVVFQAAVAIAGILTLASSVLLVLLTVVFNLISDLVGGIRLTVIEEETVRVRRKDA